MSLDQRINETVLSLEQELCRGLGAAPLAQAIRNIKLKALKDGLGSRLTDADFNQAVALLESKVADKRDFQTKLSRAQSRNTPGHRELLTLLAVIGSDSSLSVLTKGPFSTPSPTTNSGGPSIPTATPRPPQAAPPTQQPLPKAPNSTAPTAPTSTATPPSLPTRTPPTAPPPPKPTPDAATPGPGPTTTFTNPLAPPTVPPPPTQPPHPLHQQQQQQHLQQQQLQQQQLQQRRASGSGAPSASSTPAGVSRASSGNSRAAHPPPNVGPMAASVQHSLGRPAAQPQPQPQPQTQTQPQTNVGASLGAPQRSSSVSDANTVISPTAQPPTHPFSAHRPRPVFPLPTADSSDAPQPSVPCAGDLFKLDGPGTPAHVEEALLASRRHEAEAILDTEQRDQARAAASSSLSSLLESIPAWHMLRPHLTGRDLVEAAATPKPSLHAEAPQQNMAGARGASQQQQQLQQPLSMLPTDVQEVAIANDLLYAFMGLEARYVQARLVNPPTQASSSKAAGAGPGAAAAAAGPALTFGLAEGLGLEPCLAELVHRVLPICDYVAVLQRFIETRSALTYGRVSHAVAAALWRLLQDWLLMVTQLEHQLRLGTLRLQALVYYCQGPLSSLGLLANIAAEAASQQLTSAGLLNLLHTKAAALAGDRAKRALVHRLLHAAAAPYFKMLERWLHDGVLEDAYCEFMVQANKITGKDALTDNQQLVYWHSRYTLRPSPVPGPGGGLQLDVPVFLQGCANLILTTGKYLNAIHECRRHMAAESRPSPSAAAASWSFGTQQAAPWLAGGGRASRHHRAAAAAASKGTTEAGAATAAVTAAISGVSAAGATAAPAAANGPSTARPRLMYDPHSSFVHDIMAAHARASAALLHLLRSEQEVGLLTWLRSLKHFFLLDQGDLVVHLAEAAREELDKPVRDISRPRLQSLLELAIRTSSVAQDPHADELSVELDPRSVLELSRDAGALMHLTMGTSGATPTGTPQRLAQGKPATPPSAIRRPRAEDELGWSALLLSFRLSWPVTLIVPPRALAQYQTIFKHLFNLKHAERQLAAAWHRMQAARNASRAGRNALKPAYCLAQRHLFLIQEILRYSTTDVLAPQWAAMEAGVRRAADADQVIHCHATFLSRTLDGLMLSRLPLLRPLLALQQGALDFAARVNVAWDALEQRQAQAAEQQQAAAAEHAALMRQASRTGAARVPAPTQSITAAREQPYEGLLGPSSRDQSSPQSSDSQYLDITGLEAEYSSRLSELVSGLQDMYSTAIQQEAGESNAGAAQELDSREQLEALQGLIERIAFDTQLPFHKGAPGQKSTQALLAELQSAAAQY